MKTHLLSGLAAPLVLTLIVAVLVPGEVSADHQNFWLVSFPNLYPVSTLYNVGVGTMSPVNNFHSMESSAVMQPGQRYTYAIGIFERNGSSVIQIIGDYSQEKLVNFAEFDNGAHGAIKYDYTGVPGGADGFTFWVSGNQYRGALTGGGDL